MPHDHIDLPTKTILGYVTPSILPREAIGVIREWRASKRPAFIKAYEYREDACLNCQGSEVLIINLIHSGPYRAPTSGVITWLDGADEQREGWYRIEKTLAYPCPKCGVIT